MITKQALLERIYTYLSGKIDILANDNPMIGFVRPLSTSGSGMMIARNVKCGTISRTDRSGDRKLSLFLYPCR